MITLYHFWESGNSREVRIVLARRPFKKADEPLIKTHKFSVANEREYIPDRVILLAVEHFNQAIDVILQPC